MKALTIKQPWASLILAGKDIENRDWPTKIRGTIAIHSSAKMAASDICEALSLGFRQQNSKLIISRLGRFSE